VSECVGVCVCMCVCVSGYVCVRLCRCVCVWGGVYVWVLMWGGVGGGGGVKVNCHAFIRLILESREREISPCGCCTSEGSYSYEHC